MIKLKKSFALVLVLLTALAMTACNKDSAEEIEEGVKAKVNDKVITEEEYNKSVEYYKNMIEQQMGTGSWETERAAGQTWKSYYEEKILDEMIINMVLLDAAEKSNTAVTEEEIVAELDNYKVYFNNDEEYQKFLTDNNLSEEFLREEIKEYLLINNYAVSKIETLKPTDEELNTLFNDMKMNESVRASHILVDTEEEAKAVIDRINKGESFEELAKELSKDPGSGANGGDLDYFDYVDMVQPFSDAAFAMEIGEISEPVKSDFGYHVIKVTDKTVDNAVTAETEKTVLTEYYKSAKYEELLDKLKSEAKIVQ